MRGAGDAERAFRQLDGTLAAAYSRCVIRERRGGRLLRNIFKPWLDPGRPERVYREFDEERGFRAYHERCRAAFARDAKAPNAPINEAGFEHLEVMSQARAEDLLARAAATGPLTYVKKDTRSLEGFRLGDPRLVEEILGTALPAAVDDRAVRFFGSEYLVHWFTLARTAPAPEQKSVSFRWHCDKGPRGHLKLLVYLNATDEHGGNTALVDLAGTARVARTGYLFGPAARRSDDLAVLSRLAGSELRECRRPLRAGDGLLFQPANVLHRGISPPRGPRVVLTLCLLPSPIPWREAFRRGVMSDLAQDDKWPPHASELLDRLDAAAVRRASS